jgi:small subunit ribosomal protein S13
MEHNEDEIMAEEKDKDKFAKKEKGKEPAKAAPSKGMTARDRLMLEAREAEKEGLKGIIHLVGKDVSGKMRLTPALRQVKGVGMRLAPIFANAISKALNLPNDVYVGKLSDEQIEKLESILQSPEKYGVPGWLLNRQKDLDTGSDRHFVGVDLTFSNKQDIEREKDLYTWRGYSHIYRKKVRGQGTRTSGRRGMTMGVAKKSIQAARTAAAAAPAAGAKKEEKK